MIDPNIHWNGKDLEINNMENVLTMHSILKLFETIVNKWYWDNDSCEFSICKTICTLCIEGLFVHFNVCQGINECLTERERENVNRTYFGTFSCLFEWFQMN